ncbi:MAG: hypothetical protein L0Z62_48975 [Gemmataceae bacterium]|nr:hypothetical protein [Gemmataceae bacterium]
MKRCLSAFLFLVVAGSLYVSVVAYQKFGVSTERTFPATSDAIAGFMSLPCLVDILTHVKLPDGEIESRIVLSQVLMLEKREVDPEPAGRQRPHQFITLRVNPFEAEELEQAQSRGTLRWIRRPPPPPLEERLREWLGLETRLTTLARELSGR